MRAGPSRDKRRGEQENRARSISGTTAVKSFWSMRLDLEAIIAIGGWASIPRKGEAETKWTEVVPEGGGCREAGKRREKGRENESIKQPD
jgi:hypothetical protein